MTEELSKYFNVIVEEEVSERERVLLGLVIRDALPIRAALEAGQAGIALNLVNDLLKKAQEYLDEI